MENPVQTVITTIRAKKSKEKLVFEILDGPFEGVEYSINEDSLSVEGEDVTFMYEISNPDIYRAAARNMLERIIKSDVIKRIENHVNEKLGTNG